MASWLARRESPSLRFTNPVPWVNLPDNESLTSEVGYRQPRFDYRLTPRGRLDSGFTTLLTTDGDISVQRALAVYQLVDTVSVLLRFADPRQTSFEGTPARDGSNLRQDIIHRGHVRDIVETNGSQELYSMYIHHTRVLEYLHKSSLIQIQHNRLDIDGANYGTPYTEIDYSVRNYMTELLRDRAQELLHSEQEKLAGPSGGRAVVPGCEWLLDLHSALADIMASYNAAFLWARHYGIDMYRAMDLVSQQPLIDLCRLTKRRSLTAFQT